MDREPSPLVSRRRLAAELKKAREDAHRTGNWVAERTGWSSSRLSRIEKAQVGVSFDDVRALAELYSMPSELRDALTGLAAESAERAWWDAHAESLPEPYVTFIGLEAGAEMEHTWQVMVIPGLLQTPEYAATMMETDVPLAQGVLSPGEIRRRTQVRMRRQQLLTANPPLRLEAVIDEAVLRRRFGPVEVMREQLRHLQKMGSLPNVSIRILPFATLREAFNNFVLLEFPDRGGVLGKLHPEVVHQEATNGGSFEEDERVSFAYHRLFANLRKSALPGKESLAFIGSVADQLA